MKEMIGVNGHVWFYTLEMEGTPAEQPDIPAQIKIANNLLQLCACGHKKISHFGKTRLSGCWYSEACGCRRFRKAIAPLVTG